MNRLRLVLDRAVAASAIGMCVWGQVLLIRHDAGSTGLAVNFIAAGLLLLALRWRGADPNAPARLGVVSLCYAAQAAAFLFGSRFIAGAAVFAAMSAVFVFRAYMKFREAKRGHA